MQQEEDVLFSWELNFIVLNDTEVVESTVNVWQPAAGQNAGSQAAGDGGGCPEGSSNKAAGGPA